ncbi:MAG: TIGR03936 family radical SAM-associated protein [Firmicutes bacterium]|nr:TIGR03936 family radical SAM-associated protein [Bacillota bacterium]
MYNYRARFTKEGLLRYLSHLELIRAIERAIRRAGLPIAYTEGFHPHPRLGFGPALALGIASVDEYFDMELLEEIAPATITAALNRVLPEDIRILAVKRDQNLHPKPLNAIINRVSYFCLIFCNPGWKDRIIQSFAEFFNLAEVMVERPGKTGPKQVNLRSLLTDAVVEEHGPETLGVTLTGITGSGGNLRPEEIIHWLDPGLGILSITRTGLWHEEKGLKMKPLDFCEKTGA